MKATKNISKKIIALSLALVLIVTMFAGCKKSENAKTSAEGSESKTENSTTEPIESESVVVTDDNGEPVTDESGSTVTETVTQSDKADSSSKAQNAPVSNSQTESTTKKNTSSGSQSKKPSDNTKPVNNTKPASSQSSSQCNHSWSAYKFVDTGNANTAGYFRTCSKCGKSESWTECEHTFGSWKYRSHSVKYRTCSKCGWTDEQEGDYTAQCMGNKSEYLELLRLVNKARRDAGLNELVYIDEFQKGANIRAVELTEKYSHTRPNGSTKGTAYSYSNLVGTKYLICSENIVSGADTAQQAFKAWMNSDGHRRAIMSESITGFVASRCDTYWMMQTFGPVE